MVQGDGGKGKALEGASFAPEGASLAPSWG